MKCYYFAVSIILIFVLSSCSVDDTNTADTTESNTEASYYFPPNNSSIWETQPAAELQWNTNAIPALFNYLENNNTKGFIVLHKGRIVMEQYFNGHNKNAVWYWASAGKTLTTTVVGIAENETNLNLQQPVSSYLGNDWTSATPAQEQLITSKSLLSMTSGLNDALGSSIAAEDLQYVANANTRWAYHNVFLKLQDIVSVTTNTTFTNYFNTSLKQPIGLTGSWIPLEDLNVYWSNTRSMARFGLLNLANGQWNGVQVVPETFINTATNTSQNLNKAYGYLWWLNGKNSFMLPQTQTEFTGQLIPNAPNDMYCALGKNDQKLYIVPSKDLVIVRMGQAADDENFALSNFDNALWSFINAVIE